MLDRGFYYIGVFACLIVACAALALSEQKSGTVAPSAEEAKPLAVGAELPDVEVKSAEGETVKLRAALAEKTAVIVFYRGHWCPACMKQLQGLDKIVPDLEANGTSLVAIGTDKPKIVAETIKKTNFGFPLYSDSDLSAAKAMGLAYQLDAKSLETYGPTLLENTGHDSGQLPVPAVFLVNKEGKIVFVHSDPNYKVRLSNEELLAAVKKLQD
jgi:peroxiredoxin